MVYETIGKAYLHYTPLISCFNQLKKMIWQQSNQPNQSMKMKKHDFEYTHKRTN